VIGVGRGAQTAPQAVNLSPANRCARLAQQGETRQLSAL
jgi:hypothetical protein